MYNRGSSEGLHGLCRGSRLSTLTLAMLATLSSIYVAGRLWIEAENRVYLVGELDKRIGQERRAISLDDTLKVIDCRQKLNKLSSVQADLKSAKREGFLVNHAANNEKSHKKKHLVVIGIMTSFNRQQNRDALRKAWVQTGSTRKKSLDDGGVIMRFVVGRSASTGDNARDYEIQVENRESKDIIVLGEHVETVDPFPDKMKLFFSYALENWEAQFYAKANDDAYVNIDALTSTLQTHTGKPRAYIGCMKSGEVFSDVNHKWYEPDWWKFGDKKLYFRYASGEIYVISEALTRFVQINRSVLRLYAHDDVTVGSWFIGLDVAHIHDRTFCCSSWSPGAICSAL